MMYHGREPGKIWWVNTWINRMCESCLLMSRKIWVYDVYISVLCSHLRYDTLAQMLTLANIHAGSKVLVFETCAGLVLGSIMERMGGTLDLWTFLLFLSIWPKDFSCFYTKNVFCSVLSKQSLLFALCIIALSFLLIQAMAQWFKCTQEVDLFGRVWRALASLHIFRICCMSFPSAMSTLCWQALWTPLPKTQVLVGPAFFYKSLQDV